VAVETNGESALRRIGAEAFDLILLDVMLPRKDGFEVCRDLRRSGSKIPVIMLTGKNPGSGEVLGLGDRRGRLRDQALQPPGAPRPDQSRSAPLRRRRSAIHMFGDCEVDFGRCELRRAGKPVELTALEFKLLSAFVRSGGKVLSRDQLLDLVWGHGTFVTDRVVDNHVVTLRKKIEPDPSAPRYIVSVRA